MAKDHISLAQRIESLIREVVDESPEQNRSFLPVSSYGLIQPCESAPITARAQIPFRGDRLAVWSGCAPSFMIEELRVGTRALGVSVGTAPADAFATRLDLLPFLDKELEKNGVVSIKISRMAEECFGQAIAMPRVLPGIEHLLYVTNISDRPQRFIAVILGAADYV